jgi:hypothetical protein
MPTRQWSEESARILMRVAGRREQQAAPTRWERFWDCMACLGGCAAGGLMAFILWLWVRG